MIERLLLGIALGLIFFQIAFSVYYSNEIVSYNHLYSQLQKDYQNLKFENQKLEIEFADQYTLNGKSTF